MEIIGYQISTQLPKIPINSQIVINTINPHSYCVAKNDILFKNALKESDVLLPDGIGIVLAAKILCGEKIGRIAGSDLHIHLLNEANKTSLKVFYLGASEPTLQKLSDRINLEHPMVQLASFSPPFKNEFSEADNQQMIGAVNLFAPDILFVGMTAPKQEKWVYQHRGQINSKVIASVGAVFDFYAGTVKRPGKFWQKMGLEWLIRLLREPKRLWRRNFVSTPLFIWDVLMTKLGLL